MNAVWLQVPEAFLEERRRLGHDKKDELWDGVLHMAPSPSGPHQRVSIDLLVALVPIARRLGLQYWADPTAIFGPGENWRIPDSVLARPEHASERGLEGAELVVEVLSPHDESRAKLPWYASVGVREVWLVEPRTRVVEVFALCATTADPAVEVYVVVEPRDGAVTSPLLGVRLEVIAGPLLRIHDGSTQTDL
ncbi:hypothetical protein BH11MYX1_BH11MYX1_20110 [soil metagenome]